MFLWAVVTRCVATAKLYFGTMNELKVAVHGFHNTIDVATTEKVSLPADEDCPHYMK